MQVSPLQETKTSLRPSTPADMEFLFKVYADTRAEELSVVPWSAEQKNVFLRMQFKAQHEHYQQHYGDAAFDLIVVNNVAVGRLYVQRTAHTLHIIDIALLQEYRRQGIGRGLMTQLLDEARSTDKGVEIFVEQNNPALAFYRKLGFFETGLHGVYFSMRWTKSSLQSVVRDDLHMPSQKGDDA